MSCLLKDAPPENTLAQALTAIITKFEKKSLSAAKTPIVSITVQIKPFDALSWLRCQTDKFRFYWTSRDNGFVVAAIGCAHDLRASTKELVPGIFNQLADSLATNDEKLHYIGGVCFDPENPGTSDDGFGIARFVLPFMAIHQNKEGMFVTANIPINLSRLEINMLMGKVNCAVEDLPRASIALTTKNSVVNNFPNKSQFCRKVKDVLKMIETRDVEKLVLARQTIFSNINFDPFDIIESWNNRERSANRFYFEMGQSVAFLGASPERLYLRRGREFSTEALAGTVEDGQIISSKEQDEHRYVVNMIKETLDKYCTKIQFSQKPSLRLSKGGRHLLTTFHAILKVSVTDEEIFSALHPTPAVAGTPTNQALANIRSLEPFSRRWYAGTVGVMSRKETEFAVALRCGYLQDQTLTLYSGAGIVAGSNPEAEWHETENKFRTFKVFDV